MGTERRYEMIDRLLGTLITLIIAFVLIGLIFKYFDLFLLAMFGVVLFNLIDVIIRYVKRRKEL